MPKGLVFRVRRLSRLKFVFWFILVGGCSSAERSRPPVSTTVPSKYKFAVPSEKTQVLFVNNGILGDGIKFNKFQNRPHRRFRKKLNEYAAWIVKTGHSIQLEGFASASKSKRRNLQRGMLRAENIKRILVGFGVVAHRISLVSFSGNATSDSHDVGLKEFVQLRLVPPKPNTVNRIRKP